MMKITISQEGCNPITITAPNNAVVRSEESVPRYNNVFFGIQNHFGTGTYATIDDFLNNNRERIKKWTDALKEYCKKKNWELLDEHTSSGMHTTLWTYLNKETTAKKRMKAATETWKTVNGVPMVFLEFIREVFDKDGKVIGHKTVCDVHIFCRHAGASRFFTKKVISNITLASEKARRYARDM